MIDQLYAFGAHLIASPWWEQVFWPTLWALIKIVALLIPLMLCVAYLTLWERKALGFMQVRYGPNRTGPAGLLQPIADALKLRATVPPPMTSEQRIRGSDAPLADVVLVSGYAGESVDEICLGDLSVSTLQGRGAVNVACGRYHLACCAEA